MKHSVLLTAVSSPGLMTVATLRSAPGGHPGSTGPEYRLGLSNGRTCSFFWLRSSKTQFAKVFLPHHQKAIINLRVRSGQHGQLVIRVNMDMGIVIT